MSLAKTSSIGWPPRATTTPRSGGSTPTAAPDGPSMELGETVGRQHEGLIRAGSRCGTGCAPSTTANGPKWPRRFQPLDRVDNAGDELCACDRSPACVPTCDSARGTRGDRSSGHAPPQRLRPRHPCAAGTPAQATGPSWQRCAHPRPHRVQQELPGQVDGPADAHEFAFVLILDGLVPAAEGCCVEALPLLHKGYARLPYRQLVLAPRRVVPSRQRAPFLERGSSPVRSSPPVIV
jgi:hypothetical protein